MSKIDEVVEFMESLGYIFAYDNKTYKLYLNGEIFRTNSMKAHFLAGDLYDNGFRDRTVNKLALSRAGNKNAF